jgi:hypothetical protein
MTHDDATNGRSQTNVGPLRWAREKLRRSEKSGFFIPSVLIAWSFELLYGFTSAGWLMGLRIFAILWFGSGAAFFVGSIVGFVFGVPKSRPTSLSASAGSVVYHDNTNLEEVSDWLTKLIIGVGLVEINKITIFIGQCGETLGTSIDPSGRFGGSVI